MADDMLAELVELMPDTLVAQAVVSDEFGDWVPSGAVLSLACRIEGGIRMVRDPGGREVVSSVQVLVGSSPGLTADGYRYTLPSRFVPGTNLRAILVNREADEEGAFYEEVIFP